VEVANQLPIKERFSRLLFKDALPFTKKRDVNWSVVKRFGGVGILAAVILLLLLPTPKEEEKTFHEKTEAGASATMSGTEGDPTQDALAQLQSARSNVGAVPESLDFFSRSTGSGAGQSGPDRNSSMILARDGGDSRNQLPPGSRLMVRLVEKIIVSSQAIPVIGVVGSDVVYEDTVAIPRGAKLYGEATFDDSSERAQVNWKSVRLPDGRERQISAVGVGRDGQAGVDGHLHSEAVKNAVGQTVTRFVAAYAEGSMQRGALGSNQGGADNGLKNAVSETAKDRADAWAEDMKKEKKWIELRSGEEFIAILTQAFSFRDPGVTYGR
jgi:type IV secretory pathway VirB10-like protein